MISFELDQDLGLILVYEPEGVGWFEEKLDSGYKIANTFYVTKDDLYKDGNYPDSEDVFKFVLSEYPHSDGYTLICRSILNIDFDLYLSIDLKFERKVFVAERNVSIFKRFGKLGLDELIIGGDHDDAIAEKTYQNLIRELPTPYEIQKYVIARTAAVAENYIDFSKDARGDFENYLNRKPSAIGESFEYIKEYELAKYTAILEKLKVMLSRYEDYNESRWQAEIIEIVRLIFPKYIAVLDEVNLKVSGRNSKRIDLMLVDANGGVDIIEIKRPEDNQILAKTQNRNNYVPAKALINTIMQTEKYIYHLNSAGNSFTDKLLASSKHADKLPKGLRPAITHPNGLIIMGRDEGFDQDQKEDFEIIKRKFKHIADIITYDDLIRRLGFMLAQLK